ncbi:hypothetical protein NKK52_31900 [Mesorhizobium sp. C277A]|uniref:hypothetical protein n=1 Tax=Mesorhizobium sp. C277A TaxID=2956827 RepID=UPI00333B897B
MIVGPPDYAPEVQGVVTLYDILADVGHANFGVPAPAQISFTNHIFPMLLRTRRLQWVNSDPNWSEVSEDWAALGNNTAALRRCAVKTLTMFAISKACCNAIA